MAACRRAPVQWWGPREPREAGQGGRSGAARTAGQLWGAACGHARAAGSRARCTASLPAQAGTPTTPASVVRTPARVHADLPFLYNRKASPVLHPHVPAAGRAGPRGRPPPPRWRHPAASPRARSWCLQHRKAEGQSDGLAGWRWKLTGAGEVCWGGTPEAAHPLPLLPPLHCDPPGLPPKPSGDNRCKAL